MRWPGFRKVRRQVRRRIGRRMQELGLEEVAAYRRRLEEDPAGWSALDACCRIPISRFHRDQGVFEALRTEILPELATGARERGDTTLRIWSAGCASGEEPYTLAAIWILDSAPRFPDLSLEIVATDIEPHLLERCRDGRYERGSLREVPEEWLSKMFTEEEGRFVIRPELRAPVRFLRQDLREETPDGQFDLVCCRNLAFTYFDEASQAEILRKLIEKIRPGGRLVIGQRERLPFLPSELVEELPSLRIYRAVRPRP